MPNTSTTVGYEIEPRNDGTYFAIMRLARWRGLTTRKFVVGYRERDIAEQILAGLTVNRHAE